MPRIRMMRLYRSETGIWHYETERDGRMRWASLHTRDENKARRKYDNLRAAIAALQVEPEAPHP